MTRFDYFYGSQADQFTFIRIPRALITDELFASLSATAKLLYAVLLDRMSLSMRNGWLDEQKRAYIIYQITDIQKDLGISKRKAMDYLTELVEFGLVEKIKRGFGMPSILYVKSFLTSVEDEAEEEACEDSEEEDTASEKVEVDETADSDMEEVTGEVACRGAEIDTSRGAEIDTSRSAEISTSRGAQIDTSEVKESTPLYNKTNSNKTDMNQNLILSHRIYDGQPDAIRSDEMLSSYAQLIKENIAYGTLLKDYPFQGELIEGIYGLILEIVLSRSDTILIASERYPASLVKSRFLKLDVFHIRYVIDCFNRNTTQVKNIRKYLLAALFNAPITMNGYYKAAVNHDMPQYAF